MCLILRDAGRALAVAEIVSAVEELGFAIPGARPGKSVSDALRWEVGRGRAVQIGRGLYSGGTMQRSTEYSMRKRVESLKQTIPASLVATSAANPLPNATSGEAARRDEAEPVSLVATSAADSAGAPAGAGAAFDAVELAIAQAAAEERELAMLRAAGGSAFAPIAIDDLVTPADDIEPASGGRG